MRALVTGAAGFIGSNVVRALVARGANVRALHLPGENLRALDGVDCERCPGDVTSRADMGRAARGRDVVFHLAAVYALWTRDGGKRMREVNVEGTRVVLEAARDAGVRRVVHTSSIARFGGQGMHRRATEASAFALGWTGDPYSASKNDAHELAVEAAKTQDVVIVAPCGPLGPGDVGPTPTGRLLLSTVTMPVVLAAPTLTNFIDVRDCAEGHVLAAEHGKRGETYLLGNRDLSMVEIVRMAMRASGKQKPIIVAPFAAAELAGGVARGWADRVSRRAPMFTAAAVRIARLGLRADCSKAVRELGLPQRPIETAVDDALAWFATHGYLGRRRDAA